MQSKPDQSVDQPPVPARQSTKRSRVGNEIQRRGFVTLLAGALGTLAKPTAQAANPFGKLTGRQRSGGSVYKSRAMEDYQRSLSQFGGRLASPLSELTHSCARQVPWQFDVLIVGSGYGASTVAARLAQRRLPGTRIAILERGREWVPGTFPDRVSGLLDESRLNLFGPRRGTVDKATGLFDVRQCDEITVLSGSGLGGTSLINANVAIRPDAEVFLPQAWPMALRHREILDPYYSRAEYELGVSQEPYDHSPKMIASRVAGQHLSRCGAQWQPASITVTRTGSCPANALPIVNRQGMLQRGCIDCGDCLMGCNVGAKNSLVMNYLPLAKRSGAELYTGVEVQFVRKVQFGYEVHCLFHTQLPDGQIQSQAGCLTSRMVVLGAGSLGSTEILMRSGCHGLSLSPRLGCNWTGNGDALGFVRKSQIPTGIAGHSAYPAERYPVGPTIQTNLTFPNRPPAERLLIQEGAAPRAYTAALGVLMRNPRLDQTLVLLGMGHDGAEGRIELNEHGNAEVLWPGLLDSPYRQMIRAEFSRVAQALGGQYEFLRVFGDRMVSVHPLGGCGMADDVARGVVNDGGQVFDPITGGLHAGLYVIDGAILPTSLACNPLLTITALAERSSDKIVNDPQLSDLFFAAQSS
ncbi:MAG: GMC family oxidoreductase [Pirellulaceae bacterium]|nr:GMC family oxidoreductase [Pirellulaceae bacterium]